MNGDQTRTRGTKVPKGLDVFDMIVRLELPQDAAMVLLELAGTPSTRERLTKRRRRIGADDIEAGLFHLIGERLVEARDGVFHMVPVEQWSNDAYFMKALAVRWA